MMKINSSAKIISISQHKKRLEKLEIKQFHPTLHLRWWLTVEGAADRLQCSTRRVRQLLQRERLSGAKAGKDWVVRYPLQVLIGTRGPKAKIFTGDKRVHYSQAYL